MDDLLAELALLEHRYGQVEGLEDVIRIEAARKRHQFALDRLNEELDDLLVRRRVTLDSLDHLARLERAVIRQAIDSERERRGEAWSPIPILAFRAWTVEGGRLRGAVEPWAGLSMEATCRTTGGSHEVPHTDGRCGLPACGIYALKRAEAIGRVTGWSTAHLALGLVALTGKVVEHEHGYRAQRAEILALAVQHPDGIRCVSHPVDLWPILDGAGPTQNVFGANDPYADMCGWLESQKSKEESWTSESQSA